MTQTPSRIDLRLLVTRRRLDPAAALGAAALLASNRSPLSPSGGERVLSRFLALATLILFGCSGTTGTTDAGQDTGQDAGMVDPNRCRPAEGTTGSPRTIYELLDLVNGLPHPVQLSCFLESLDRPLSLIATSNRGSAQPALSKRSPRTFILFGKPGAESLSVAFVPGAEATLEFGELDAGKLNSLKGEILFPIEAQLAPADAFTRLAPDSSTGMTLDQGTRCGTCHSANAETPIPAYPHRGAFMSIIIRPTPSFVVPVESLRRERESCDFVSEPERCAVLKAIFDYGNVTQTRFP